MSVGMVWEGPGEASDRDGLPLASHVARIGDDANAKQPRLRALGKVRLVRHGRGKKVRQSCARPRLSWLLDCWYETAPRPVEVCGRLIGG